MWSALSVLRTMSSRILAIHVNTKLFILTTLNQQIVKKIVEVFSIFASKNFRTIILSKKQSTGMQIDNFRPSTTISTHNKIADQLNLQKNICDWLNQILESHWYLTNVLTESYPQSRQNQTSYRELYFTEFVQNSLRFNMEAARGQKQPSDAKSGMKESIYWKKI